MGITWFWAFKLRSVKIAYRHIRDNPLRALLATGGMPALPDMPGVSVGSPITDNFGVAAADGRLGYSMFWGQMWNAPNLNPWVNIVN